MPCPKKLLQCSHHFCYNCMLRQYRLILQYIMVIFTSVLLISELLQDLYSWQSFLHNVQVALQRLAGARTSSGFDGVEPPFFMNKVACCCPPTSPTAPSLGPLVPSGSFIKWEHVQVYDHHLCSSIPLNSVNHIIYLSDYLIWAISWGLGFGRLPLRAIGLQNHILSASW